MFSAILTIHVEIDPSVWEKFELYYPDKESIADEIMRQIGESNALITGKNVILKFRPHKGGKECSESK